MAVERAEGGSLVLPGTFPVHDLVDLGVELLVLMVLGRIPEGLAMPCA